MQLNSYREAIDWLFIQFPSYQAVGSSAYKPDLGNIKLLCALFDDPQVGQKFIHIAGTNGKGSTASMLSSILTEATEKVGLFTSPHIIDFRERIRVNGEMISEDQVVKFCQTILDASISFEPSFFEITFAMALVHFRNKNCTISVIETGLGGRLDATNIISPIVSIITNISIEHTQFLGNTIEEIAFEKAGIIKPFIPVVIGESNLKSKPVFDFTANKNNSEIYWSEKNPLPLKFNLNLLGDYQLINLRTVLSALNILKSKGYIISDKIIQNGLNRINKNSGFFGRMQVINTTPLTILDVSHNYDGIKKTLHSIQTINKGRLFLIYGTSSDKNYKEIIELFPKDSHLSLCTFQNKRSLSQKDMTSLSKVLPSYTKVFTHIHSAIEEIQSIANKEDTILIFGSFFLISDYF